MGFNFYFYVILLIIFQGNYVLESDMMLSIETCKFDVILCLSITKWIHLNWGDAGLKRAFKRMYTQLRPGGILVVEPQPWKSYSRRKSLTVSIIIKFYKLNIYLLAVFYV